MNSQEKYLKYKSKYLALKKALFGGRRVRTIPNGGGREGMSQQCFWISILDYLNRNGHPALTLRELRTQAGLDASTEHTMFDSVIESFRAAANRIVARYNLTITILPISRDGVVLFNGSHGDRIGNGANRIEIGQYGIGHFELIVGDLADDAGDSSFVPLVSVKQKLVNLSSLPEKEKKIYDKYNERYSLLKIIIAQLEEDKVTYGKQIDEKFKLKDSTLDKQTKEQLIAHYDSFIEKLTADMKGKKTKIASLQSEIAELKKQIDAYESTLP
jgi:hypothetical protein